jgi:hypothetical protein
MREATPETAPPPEPVPRIARLMAVAIVFDEMVRKGRVKDYAELARLTGVSPARTTQFMGLLNLAPDIQMSLLAQHIGTGLSERLALGVAHHPHWSHQRTTLPALASRT